eukprot:scaffold126136_cov36-Phaeocystis_antarctica.AAC.1
MVRSSARIFTGSARRPQPGHSLGKRACAVPKYTVITLVVLRAQPAFFNAFSARTFPHLGNAPRVGCETDTLFPPLTARSIGTPAQQAFQGCGQAQAPETAIPALPPLVAHAVKSMHAELGYPDAWKKYSRSRRPL